ncbi:unnamed protein product [Cylicocyclus nassatus]|uniref:Uncharacterized protein n=1 Tax=Cylicocyclus nassatus TaxID=53992 RepID=A0AA36M2N2_CYLNA|nr:unnamed protein product [Cylicocyclus nassatus]
MINSLDQNRMITNGMIFHGINAITCTPQLMIDLFKTSRIASLIMIDCEIPVRLAEWLEREFVPTLDKYYIGSSHSFINYGDNKILTDDWLTALLQKMHGSESVDKDDEFISLGIPHRFSNLGSYEDQDEITKRYIAHLIKIQKNAC